MDANSEPDLEQWLDSQERQPTPSARDWRQRLLEALPYLRLVLPINQIERVERVLKQLLRVVLAQDLDGPSARFLANFQRDLGFVLKLKSYALKCTTPLGYSIFLQNPYEGFSFQRHITRKTEVFHILQPLDGARVFLCSSDEWDAVYERQRFSSWLAGQPDAALDSHAIVPRSGDVFHVDRFGVVHSVLGCILEEFATVSVDMVDRLHDQNASRPTKLNVQRAEVEERLKHLPVPETNVDFPPGKEKVDAVLLRATVDCGVTRVQLSTGLIEATRYVLEPGCSGSWKIDHHRAAEVFVLGGRGEIALGDLRELERGLPSINVVAGDLLLVPPRTYRAFRAARNERLVISEHRIEPGLALD